MQFLVDLWVPILVAGLATFVVSALAWTVFPHHKKEFGKLASEDAVMDAIRAGNPGPGLYSTPHMADFGESGSAEGKAKMMRGPITFITVAPGGVPQMGPMMAKSFLFNVFVAAFIAYIAWHTLPAGTEYLQVFRVTGSMGFMAYAFGSIPESIWFARPWSSLLLQAFDSMLTALVLAGIFGWLWP
ncbi:MAG: hypothetical protein OEW77_04755 [Gemmatimonadota bacterium]|nr:hypothetical protein [Gemmatimonadota bacterium]